MVGNHLEVSAADGEKMCWRKPVENHMLSSVGKSTRQAGEMVEYIAQETAIEISENSDSGISGENTDSLLDSLNLSRIEAFLKESGGSAAPGISFREILSMLLSGNYRSVVRTLLDSCRTALFREISENGSWMGQVVLLGVLGAVFASFSSLFADSQVSEMGFYVTYLLIFTLLAASFLNGVRITRCFLRGGKYLGGSRICVDTWLRQRGGMGVFTVVSAMYPVVRPAVAGGAFKFEGFIFKSIGIAGTGDEMGQQGTAGGGAGISCAAGNDCAVYGFGAPDGSAAGGQPDTGNRTGRCGRVTGIAWKRRSDPEYGGRRGSVCDGSGVTSAAVEAFNPLSGVPGKRGAFAAGQ